MGTLTPAATTVDAWPSYGASIERPKAVLVLSAHWYANATAVTAMARPRTIHDFYGWDFPHRHPPRHDRAPRRRPDGRRAWRLRACRTDPPTTSSLCSTSLPSQMPTMRPCCCFDRLLRLRITVHDLLDVRCPVPNHGLRQWRRSYPEATLPCPKQTNL